MEQLQFGSILPVDRPESSGASFAASTAASDAGSGAAVAEAVSLDYLFRARSDSTGAGSL